MTNNNHRLRATLLLIWGALIFGFGCASVPKSGETSSSAEINETFVLPTPLNFSPVQEGGLVEKAEVEPQSVHSNGANTKPEATGDKKPSVNEDSNTKARSISPSPQKDIEIAKEPSLRSMQKGSGDLPSISDILPNVHDKGEQDSPSVFEKMIEDSPVSDTAKTLKAATSGQGEKTDPSHLLIPLTAPAKLTGEGNLVEDSLPDSNSLIAPVDSSRPRLSSDLLQSEGLSGEFQLKTAGSDSINPILDKSDPPKNSVSGETVPIDNLVTSPLLGSNPQELPPVTGDLTDPSSSVTDMDKADIDLPTDSGFKSIGFSPRLAPVSLTPQNPPASIALKSKLQSPNENLSDDGEGKVSFFGDESSSLPTPRPAPVSEVRLLDRKNGILKRSVAGAGKTLGFSDRRANDRFLQRQVAPSVSQRKRALQESGKPQKYDSLRDFLADPSNLGSNGSAPSSSPSNYKEVENFLKATESTRDLEFNQNAMPSEDGRYQNALQWLRSRGQGDEEPN